MTEYEKSVIDARKNKTDKRFPNSIIDHARILTREIILDADKRVCVLSDYFNEYFYKKLEDNIVNFLKKDKNNKFEIIIMDEQGENNLINKLKEQFKNQIEVKLINKSIFPIDNDSGERVNFVVNDNNAFRYEYSDKNLGIGVVSAIANFNHKSDSEKLMNAFEQLKQTA